ncbi:unnamed protein product, partial [Rotaria sp. Silwood2]
MCSNCGSLEAKLWCKKCETSYCSECYALVHAIPILKKHVSVPIDQKPVIFVRCEQHHDEQLQFWCNACTIPVCCYCITFKHQGHTWTPITDIAP